jgi:anti-sigma-K factor RskA
MSEIRIRVTGWKAIVVLLLAAAFVGYRYYAVQTTLETGAADELRFWLAAEYMAQGLPALEDAVARGDAAAAEEQAREIVARDRIEFIDMSARGAPEDLAVRVRIRVDGRAPPDGREVRYFRMRHSTVTGWRMRRETTKLGYYLTLF